MDSRYEEAKAVAVQRMLENDEEVRTFRERHLPDGLLARSEIPTWIDANAGDPPGDPRGLSITWWVPRGRTETGDGGRGTEHRMVEAGSPADRCARLARELADELPHDEGDVTGFLLTGVLGPAPTIEVLLRPNGRHPALGTIVLTIDPTTPTSDVSSEYSETRRWWFGEGRPPRRPNERLLHLLVFDSQQPTSSSWADRARAWDQWCAERGHEGWTYEGRSNHYRRDVDATERRLLNGTQGDEA